MVPIAVQRVAVERDGAVVSDLEGRYALMRAEAAYVFARSAVDDNGKLLYTGAELDELRDWITRAKGEGKP